jgi:predicted nucleic acid-binding protein
VILVESHVLIDVVTRDPAWLEWSRAELNAAAASDELAINDVVYAELSVRYQRIDELDDFVARSGLAIVTIPRAALFQAGKAFQRYRVAGGVRTGVLPDFFIGAHAAVTESRLITRDASRFRTYFPEVRLIAPSLA